MLGYSANELKSMGIADITHPDDVKLSFNQLRNLKEGTKDRVTFEKRFVRKNGSLLHGRLSATANRDARGALTSTVSIVEDITATKKAEARLAEHQDELVHAQRIATLGELVSGIAHELNQPLTAIENFASGSIRRLREPQADLGLINDTLAKVVNQTRRASEVIRHLRDLSRSGASHFAPVDVNRIVKGAVELIAMGARPGEYDIALQLSPSMPDVMADAIQIEQVILNLVRNAGDAMASMPVSDRRVIVSSATNGAHVIVSVIDHGCGVHRDHADKLFDSFFTTKHDGIGMGLSICRWIMENHDGRIWHTANPNGGTTFRVELVRADLERGPTATAGS